VGQNAPWGGHLGGVRVRGGFNALPVFDKKCFFLHKITQTFSKKSFVLFSSKGKMMAKKQRKKVNVLKTVDFPSHQGPIFPRVSSEDLCY